MLVITVFSLSTCNDDMKGQARKMKKLLAEKDRRTTAFSIWLKHNERVKQLKQTGADVFETAKAASVEWRAMTDAEKAKWRKQQPFQVQTSSYLHCADVKKSPDATKVRLKVSIQAVNFFTFLPVKIIVDHIFRLLLPAHYSTLHLVSRRFRRLLIDYARLLPRVELVELWFEVEDNTSALIVYTYKVKSTKPQIACRNIDSWANISHQDALTPKFSSMARHIEFTGLLKFDHEFPTSAVLEQLTMMALTKQLKPDTVEFDGCMKQITDEQLAFFLQALSQTMTNMTVGHYSFHCCWGCCHGSDPDRKIFQGLFTDTLLKPIVSSGRLQVLELLKPLAVTDETLDNFQIPERFVLDFAHQKVTIQGVRRFIQRFQACETVMKPNEKQLVYLNVDLEEDLRRVVSPEERRTRFEDGITWIVKKNPKEKDSPILMIEFDVVSVYSD